MKDCCPVCASKEIFDIGRKGDFVLAGCRACDFSFLRNEFAYSDYYNSFYFENYDNPEALMDRSKTKNGDYGYSHDRQGRGQMYRMAFDALSRFIPLNGKRCLDVGCAEGVGMEVARSLGAEAYGIDVSNEAVDACRAHGLVNAYRGELAEMPVGNFDCVTMLDVVEHFQDPVSSLRALNGLVVSGGYVYIRNNLFDISSFGSDKDYFDRQFEPPYHCSYFSESGLKKIMRDSGFVLVYRKPKIINRLLESYAWLKRCLRPEYRKMHDINKVRRLSSQDARRMAKGSRYGEMICKFFPAGFVFRKVSR